MVETELIKYNNERFSWLQLQCKYFKIFECKHLLVSLQKIGEVKNHKFCWNDLRMANYSGKTFAKMNTVKDQ